MIRLKREHYFLKPCGGGGGGTVLPFCDGAAKGEAGAANFFLSCLGFFFSRLLRCSLLAISHLCFAFSTRTRADRHELSATAGVLKVPRRPQNRKPRASTRGFRVRITFQAGYWGSSRCHAADFEPSDQRSDPGVVSPSPVSR